MKKPKRPALPKKPTKFSEPTAPIPPKEYVDGQYCFDLHSKVSLQEIVDEATAFYGDTPALDTIFINVGRGSNSYTIYEVTIECNSFTKVKNPHYERELSQYNRAFAKYNKKLAQHKEAIKTPEYQEYLEKYSQYKEKRAVYDQALEEWRAQQIKDEIEQLQQRLDQYEQAAEES